MKEYFIGASIGAHNQYTAAVVIERDDEPLTREYHLLRAERFLMGSTYPEIAEKLKTIQNRIEKRTPEGVECQFIVDITGVGDAVMDLFERRDLHADAEVNITTGVTETCEAGKYSVPKKNLVSVMQILIQEKRLKIPNGMPSIDAVVKELHDFRMNAKLSPDPLRVEEAWRENSNDDYVFSVAVALWWAEKMQPSGGPSMACFIPTGRRRSFDTGEPLTFPIHKRGMEW